jgi:cold shock CspA family protein
MRFDGKLEKWNDDRGFGFITPSKGGDPVFVHISAFQADGRRPRIGELLSFEVEPDGAGKRRAINVQRPRRSGLVSAGTSSSQRHTRSLRISAIGRRRSHRTRRCRCIRIHEIHAIGVAYRRADRRARHFERPLLSHADIVPLRWPEALLANDVMR